MGLQGGCVWQHLLGPGDQILGAWWAVAPGQDRRALRGLWEGAPGCPSGPLINMDTGSAGAGATLCRGCTEFIRKRPFLPAKGGPGGLVRTAASRAGCGGPVSQGTCSPGQAWDCSMKNGHRGAGGQRSRRAARHNINGIISGAEHFHTPRAFAHIY